MTNRNYSHITLIVDRSGSMESMKSDANGGIKNFIKEQQQGDGIATLLLADFDSQNPFNIVFDGNIKEFKSYQIHPRATTPLLDAVGIGIAKTKERLDALVEDARPGNVFLVVCTDGGENASREYNKTNIVESIKSREDTDGWTFVFLATGADAWGSAQLFAGTKMMNNTVRNAASGKAYAQGMAYASTQMMAARAGVQNVSFAADVDEEGNVTES